MDTFGQKQIMHMVSLLDLPFGIVWNSWVPSRLCFIAWEAKWGRILTLDQLKREELKDP
ncbi:hypothetical protein CK203_004987 [Vitis vinifera]|uniref:Reverse transcriptase zinc-binding domain-containing protein n=1 Tax=Vitis vinifera TaxID=29760 RepID=A0A438KF12_VITVI|nr:hypothetical protein CK203_004987 [Vitis vinifera]